MPESLPPDLLARYLTDDVTPDEAARVRAWLEAHPQARLNLHGLDELPAGLAHRRDPEAALLKLQRRIRRAQKRPADRPPVRRTRIHRYVTTAFVVAAVVLVVALLRPVSEPAPIGAPALVEFVTQPGERRQVTLPDGSLIELNVASRLHVPETFAEDRREVVLEGEAFFDVARDPARPFVIRSGEAVVEVLGTAFNVKAYPEETPLSVVVTEGRVAFQSEQAARVMLTPGQAGVLTGTEIRVADVDPALFTGWRRGVLRFEGTPLAEVARTLARWYDVDIALAAQDLGERRLDAAFQNEPLPDVLATIAAALELQYEIEGRSVILTDER